MPGLLVYAAYSHIICNTRLPRSAMRTCLACTYKINRSSSYLTTIPIFSHCRAIERLQRRWQLTFRLKLKQVLASRLDVPFLNFWLAAPIEPFATSLWRGSNRNAFTPNPLAYFPQMETDIQTQHMVRSTPQIHTSHSLLRGRNILQRCLKRQRPPAEGRGSK